MSDPSETLKLLPSFLDILSGPLPITIPAPTFLGAVTHFLSQLDSPHLGALITAVLSSPSLWTSELIAKTDIRDAIRAAVPTKVSRIEEELNGVYFSNARKKRKAQEWLLSITQAVEQVDNGPEAAKIHVLAGLLRGLDDVKSMDWSKGRRWIEEDLVYSLSEIIEGDRTGNVPRDGLEVLCEVVPYIDMARLWALDVDKLLETIEIHLYTLVNPTSDVASAEAEVPRTAQALARTFEVLHSGGPSRRENASQAMRKFCVHMRGIGEKLESEGLSALSPEVATAGDDGWIKHKTAFFAFLLPASTILDLLLSSSSFYAETVSLFDLPRPVELSIQMLSTLASFAYLTDASQGGFEHYHRIFYGCLDLISGGKTQGGDGGNDQRVLASNRLLEELWREDTKGDARAAFVLVIAEELMPYLSSKSIERCLPLAERHVYRPEHRSSFEAAHAFLLGLLRSVGESLDSRSPQTAFFDALLPNYLNILTKQAKRGDISSEQLRSAFPIIFESASHRSYTSIQLCLTYPSNVAESADIRSIKISCAPHIPAQELSAYLERLAQMILGVEQDSEERLDLSKQAFEMVVKDLGDHVKVVGIDWWTRHRDEFEGRSREMGLVRSRL
ncbi:hypothetical protein IAT40_003399 [Kwoniella sp. CBS 6097]